MNGQSPVLSRLLKFDGRDRPLSVVTGNRNSQAVHFVEPNSLHRAGFSVRENHGFAYKLSLGLCEFVQYRRRMDLRSWHRSPHHERPWLPILEFRASRGRGGLRFWNLRAGFRLPGTHRSRFTPRQELVFPKASK